MASEAPIAHDPQWSVVHLREITTKIGSGATPKGGADAYLPARTNYALVRSQNVFDGRFDPDGLAFITDEQAAELHGVVLQPADILLNITGDGVTFGRACIVPTEILPACVNQHVSIVRVDPRRADAGYVLAFLTHPDVKPYIESFNAGGSRRAITKGHIESFRVPLPPLPVQRKIASILGALDDKIELNRRMSQTFESMARALFKSWFVDFDPVRAKSEGRDSGLASPVADLFPSSFEDSELGEIPAGWYATTIGSIADVVDCSHAKKPERRENGRPLLQLGNIRQDGVLDMSDPYLVGDSDYHAWTARIEASPGDCVVTNVGRVGAVAQVPSDVRAALGRNMTAVRCRRGKPWPTYLVEALRSDSMRNEIVRKTDAGTILDALNVRSIPRLRVAEPSTPVLFRFETVARPLRAKLESIERESRGLHGLRDAMLPSLLAGDRIGQIGWLRGER